MVQRLLTQEQIAEAKQLREKLGLTKRQLADLFNVGASTIWDNVFKGRLQIAEHRKMVRRQILAIKRNCVPCSVCQICLRKDFVDGRIPLSYQVDDKCIVCYLRQHGLEYMDLYK